MSETQLFLSAEGTVPHTQAPAVPTTAGCLFSVGDAASAINTSVTTVKRIAAELRLDLLHTVGGVKLFTPEQVQKLKIERQRRQMEAWR